MYDISFTFTAETEEIVIQVRHLQLDQVNL